MAEENHLKEADLSPDDVKGALHEEPIGQEHENLRDDKVPLTVETPDTNAVTVDPAASPRSEAGSPRSKKMRTEAEPLSLGQSTSMIIRNSIPSAARMAFMFLSQNISFVYVGQYLSAEEMSGISAGLTFLWMIGIFPCMGISCAADTLCSQEYGRNNESVMLGVYARRGILVNLLYAIPVFIVAINSEAILTVMFDATMSKWASVWLRYSVLYLFPQGCMIIMAKYTTHAWRSYVGTNHRLLLHAVYLHGPHCSLQARGRVLDSCRRFLAPAVPLHGTRLSKQPASQDMGLAHTVAERHRERS